jgi:hypothetical protein
MSLGTGAGMCAKDKEVEKTGQEGNAARQSKPEPEKTFRAQKEKEGKETNDQSTVREDRAMQRLQLLAIREVRGQFSGSV